VLPAVFRKVSFFSVFCLSKRTRLVNPQIAGTIEIGLSLVDLARLTNQYRTEMLERLDRLESQLECRIKEAESDPKKARSLLGVEHMTPEVMEIAMKTASSVRSRGCQHAMGCRRLNGGCFDRQ